MGILYVAARIFFTQRKRASKCALSNAYCLVKVLDWMVTNSFVNVADISKDSRVYSPFACLQWNSFSISPPRPTFIPQNLHQFMACNQNLVFTLDFKSLYSQLYLHIQCNFQCIYNEQTICSMHFRNFYRISWLLLWVFSVRLFIHLFRSLFSFPAFPSNIMQRCWLASVWLASFRDVYICGHTSSACQFPFSFLSLTQ